MCRVVCAGVTIPTQKHACVQLGASSLLSSSHCRGLEVRKFAHLLGTEGNPLPQLCICLRNGAAGESREKFLALIFTTAVLNIEVTSPEGQNWAD